MGGRGNGLTLGCSVLVTYSNCQHEDPPFPSHPDTKTNFSFKEIQLVYFITLFTATRTSSAFFWRSLK